jgi:hypothetical protein
LRSQRILHRYENIVLLIILIWWLRFISNNPNISNKKIVNNTEWVGL